MATELYFDTARLGRMCSRARTAEQDFSKLASQLGSSLYFERFLAEGHGSLPSKLRERLPGLACWHGIAGLKGGLQHFVNLPSDGSVLLASHSHTLITLGAECLFDHSDRVLATDLEWPPYLAVLKRTAVQRGKKLGVLAVRQRVLSQQMDKATLVREIVQAHSQGGFNGLLLSDITNTGVKLPIWEIMHAIRSTTRPCFTVIDGAQALAHHPVDLTKLNVDLYLAGTQKWFGGYHPLRLAFAASGVDRAYNTLRNLIAKGRVIDPLFDFCQSIESGAMARFGETVNLVPLITAAGALAGWRTSLLNVEGAWRARRRNRRRVIEALSAIANSAIHESLASAALLMRVNGRQRETCGAPASLRDELARQGIVASEPLSGLVRLAMPDRPMRSQRIARLCNALAELTSRKVLPTDNVRRFSSEPQCPS